MTDEQLTALAREYAEECCPIEAYLKAELIDPDKEEIFERKADILATQVEFEQFLQWLTRHYCLVEKSKFGEAYYIAKYNYDNAESDRDKELALAKREILDFIIPEIAKEVEE